MRLWWGYGSEQKPNFRAVMHVVHNVGMTIVKVVCACGTSKGGQMGNLRVRVSVWGETRGLGNGGRDDGPKARREKARGVKQAVRT